VLKEASAGMRDGCMTNCLVDNPSLKASRVPRKHSRYHAWIQQESIRVSNHPCTQHLSLFKEKINTKGINVERD
jgi:hypothetical protein